MEDNKTSGPDFSLEDFFSRQVKREGVPVVDFSSKEEIKRDIVDFIIYKINQRYGFQGTNDALNKWVEYKEILRDV